MFNLHSKFIIFLFLFFIFGCKENYKDNITSSNSKNIQGNKNRICSDISNSKGFRWDIDFHHNAPFCQEPIEIRDFDFVFDDDPKVYFTLKINGYLFQDFCDESQPFRDVEYVFDDQGSIKPRWKYNFSCNFKPQSYEITTFTDETRTTSDWSFKGSISFNDPYLVDAFDMYPSYLYSIPQGRNVPRNKPIDLSCTILQPGYSTLEVNIRDSQNQIIKEFPQVTFYEESSKYKSVSLQYSFTKYGNYTIEYKIITKASNYHIIPNAFEYCWKDRTNDFIDIRTVELIVGALFRK